MITLAEYFGPHRDCGDVTVEREANAATLLEDVNRLLAEAEQRGIGLLKNPATGSLVGGQTFGGFRPQSCTIGAAHSAHKEGLAVDVYDPEGALDGWITDRILESYDLYREHPADTNGWAHLTSRAPPSGRRSFHP